MARATNKNTDIKAEEMAKEKEFMRSDLANPIENDEDVNVNELDTITKDEAIQDEGATENVEQAIEAQDELPQEEKDLIEVEIRLKKKHPHDRYNILGTVICGYQFEKYTLTEAQAIELVASEGAKHWLEYKKD